jgi:hypothetical protein
MGKSAPAGRALRADRFAFGADKNRFRREPPIVGHDREKTMWSSVLALGSALLLYISLAQAQQPPEATGPYRADYLRDACSTLLERTANKEASGRAVAEGTCAGAISTVMRLGPMMRDQFRFCPPPEATPTEVIPLVLKFLDENPAAQKLDIRDLANYVGRLTWPCK